MGELTAEKAGRKILLDRTGGGLLSSKKEKGVAGAIGAVWLVITAFRPGRYQRAARLLPSIFAAAESRFFMPAGA